MDKQFARILMLTVILPAGAALAEALEHEQSAFSALAQPALSQFPAANPNPALLVTVAEHDRPSAIKPAKQVRDIAQKE